MQYGSLPWPHSLLVHHRRRIPGLPVLLHDGLCLQQIQRHHQLNLFCTCTTNVMVPDMQLDPERAFFDNDGLMAFVRCFGPQLSHFSKNNKVAKNTYE